MAFGRRDRGIRKMPLPCTRYSLILILLLAGPSLAAQLLDERGLYDYAGDLDHGKLRIGLTLFQRDGQRVSGSYFYRKHLKDIPLSGEFTGERDLVLKEKGAAGQVAGTFRLHFAEQDPRHSRSNGAPLTIDVLTGTWMNGGGSKTYPVYLALTQILPGAEVGHRYRVAGAEDDTVVERNAQAFWRAVVRGDRSQVAKVLRYPVSFSIGGKRTTAGNSQSFLSMYDRLFTKKFVGRIREGVPHNMFANAQGIMLADGAVWFDAEARVFALNP